MTQLFIHCLSDDIWAYTWAGTNSGSCPKKDLLSKILKIQYMVQKNHAMNNV